MSNFAFEALYNTAGAGCQTLTFRDEFNQSLDNHGSVLAASKPTAAATAAAATAATTAASAAATGATTATARHLEEDRALDQRCQFLDQAPIPNRLAWGWV